MTFARHDLRDAFLEALVTAADVVAQPVVGAAWVSPSCVTGFTVGGLASHAFLATRRVRHRLQEPEPPSESDVLPLGAYYGTVRMDSPLDVDLPFHVTIRRDGEHVAGRGHDAVVNGFADLAATLGPLVAATPLDRRLAAGEGGAVSFADFLATRVVELVIHIDDVCASCGQPARVTPGAATVAIDTLLAVARHRSGDSAVLRALARGERAEADVLRAL